MNADTFLENFGHLADAPGGVARLREMVLQLAANGRLVPHDEADAPADMLVEAMIAYKKSHPPPGRQGRGKTPVTENAVSHNMPTGWALTQIGVVLHVIRGSSPRPKGDPRYFATSRRPYHWIKISDLSKHSRNGVLYDTDEFLTEEGHTKSVLVPKGTLVLTNSATIGVPAIVGMEGGCIHDGFLAFPQFPHDFLNQQYFMIVLKTLTKHAKREARGLAQLNLNTGLVRAFPLAIPPRPEQDRIVAKVDELMALCDELEAQQQERRKVHVSLNTAALDRLTSAENDTEFQPAWTRVRSNFDLLYSVPENIQALRQTILQLAVQGKLVKQDPNDESAENLLSRVFAEKRELEDSGRIKKQAATRPVGDSEVLFRIPSSWQWVRAAEVCYPISSGSTPNKSVFQADPEGGVPYLKVYNIRNQEIDFEYKPQFINEEHHRLKMKRSILLPGMIVLNIVGPPLGKTAIIPDTYAEWNCNQAIAFFRLIGDLLPQFVHLFFREGSFLRTIALIGTAGQDNISVTKCKNIMLPIPPLNEQKRIVERVQQLLTLCDDLENTLTQQQADADRLTEAMVASILDGAAVQECLSTTS